MFLVFGMLYVNLTLFNLCSTLTSIIISSNIYRMSEKKVYLAFIGKMAITTFKMIQNEKVGDVLDICYKMGTKIIKIENGSGWRKRRPWTRNLKCYLW